MNEKDKLNEMMSSATSSIFKLNPEPQTMIDFLRNIQKVIMKTIAFNDLIRPNDFDLDERKILDDMARAIADSKKQYREGV